MGSIGADLCRKIHPHPVDQFDRLPDSLILLIFNQIGDVKALGRCCVVSRRFHSLVPQVDNVVVRVDCVISDEDSSSNSPSSAAADKSRHPISSIFRTFFPASSSPCSRCLSSSSPRRVLKNFNEIKQLRIELPTGELGIDEGVLLKWKAEFGSTLESCVILGAESVSQSENSGVNDNGAESGNGGTQESFYTNGGLRQRVVWTISSLIAASARHYLLQPIIAEHKTLDSLVLTDADEQGVLSMNKEQLEELRVRPLSASSASKRTLVPALNMRLWYAPQLELPNGVVLKGATLVAIRPSEQPKKEAAAAVGSEANWVASAFEEPFGTAARMIKIEETDASGRGRKQKLPVMACLAPYMRKSAAEEAAIDDRLQLSF
ncbi:hypothetical protein SASPL_157067 [Salvia splendens]|uniref:F-box domain-containing protein n=1 Tax=Salvia splendens TaxID=180675 RepID=A0A8X8YW29_SALSN|nr:hypothetical protein SASPL_157067 [Salvia splendens]